MARPISIDNPVIIEDNTGSLAYMTAKLNNKTIGIPVLRSSVNSVSLLQPTMGLKLDNPTLYTDEDVSPFQTPDEALLGIAFKMNGRNYSIPIYEIPQNDSDIITMTFTNTTIATDMVPLIGIRGYPKILLVSIANSNYGIPLFDYSSIYDLSTGIAERAKPLDGETNFTEPTVNTIISIGKPTLDFGSEFGSTYLNSRISAYSDLIERIKKIFGFPMVEADICDENIASFIDQAIELYSKTAGYTEEFLVFSTSLYQRGVGIRLDKLFSMTLETSNKNLENAEPIMDYDLQNYRKVLNCFAVEPGQSSGVNTLFTLEQAMAQQTYFSYLLGSYGFDLVTWNCVKYWLEEREKVLAQKIHFRFDPSSQYLRILPEPIPNQNYLGLISCYVEKPIKDLIKEYWVYSYAVALTSIAIGRLRSKYQFQLLGGATITGESLLSQGLQEKKELEEQLWTGKGFVESQPMFFVG